MTELQGLKPVYTPADGGEALWWMGGLAVIRASAKDTGGTFSIIDVTEPPNTEAPLHVHHNEDEGFWILEGNATFYIEGQTIEAGPGDYLFGPRGIPHRYTTGPAGCRMLFILTPGGMEDMVREMSEPAATRTLPPPSDEEPDYERIMEIARCHGGEILG
jgi:quercetin dioxygenase-like cupin family protein